MSGWITHPRVSPIGDAVAFLDHPILGDDHGSVAIVDRAGNDKTPGVPMRVFVQDVDEGQR